jgi:AraC-like DNA-binding protein
MQFYLTSEKTDVKWERIWFRTLVHIPGELYPIMVKFTGYTRCFPGWGFEYKKTDMFGIEYVCAGNAVLLQDGKEYIINKGEAFLIRKNVYHKYTVGPKGILLKRFIIIDGIELENLLRYLNIWDKDYIVINEPKKFEKLMKQITDLLSGPMDEYDLGINLSSLAFRILLLLSRSIRFEYPPVIQKALEFMQSNLNQVLTREQICGYVGMSIQHFNRIFSSYMHCSPINYFLRKKMDWSANLLKTTSLSVKEIAYMLGYNSPYHFSNQFKSHFSVSPITYRAFRDEDEE